MTRDCPYSVALSSGLDALVHSFESFACKKSNYYTRIFAKEAIKYLFNNIESALSNKDNEDAREKMLFGAYLAGISLYNAGSGPAGALSYPLGVICKVPHGIAGGFVLPYLLEHNVRNGYSQYAEIADVLGIIEIDDLTKSQKLVKLFFELYQRLNVWEFAKKYDVKSTNPQLKEYVEQLQGAFDQNPVQFKPEDGLQIINIIFK
jgi:alcohol dehydrogenase class IV